MGIWRLVAEVGSVAVVIAAWVVAFWEYPSLPRQFPTHFGFSGRPDAWGTKRMLWFYPVLMTGLYLIGEGVASLGGPDPRHRGIELKVAWLYFEMLVMFFYLEARSIAVARGRAAGLGVTFVPITLGVIIVTSLLLTRG